MKVAGEVSCEHCQNKTIAEARNVKTRQFVILENVKTRQFGLRELWYNMCMTLQKIQFVLADQRDYCAHLLSLAICARTEEVLINLNIKLAQVVTGLQLVH